MYMYIDIHTCTSNYVKCLIAFHVGTLQIHTNEYTQHTHDGCVTRVQPLAAGLDGRGHRVLHA